MSNIVNKLYSAMDGKNCAYCNCTAVDEHGSQVALNGSICGDGFIQINASNGYDSGIIDTSCEPDNIPFKDYGPINCYNINNC